jgi:hypothetical protein
VEQDRLMIITGDFQQYLKSLPGPVVRADRASPAVLERCYPLLSRELSRYSPNLLKRMRLRSIILCTGLMRDGKKQGGLTVGPYGVVILDVSPHQVIDEEFLRRAIHHELLHVMDTILEPTEADVASWARMNPKDFRYGGDAVLEALEITRENPGRRPEFPGFLNYYATVNAQEDRAELYTHMMVFPDTLRAIAVEDPIIAKKSAALKRELVRLSAEFASFFQ